MDHLPHIVNIDFASSELVVTDWQTAVEAYLATSAIKPTTLSWYNTELSGLTIDEARELVAQAGFGSSQLTSWVILAAETTAPATQNVLLKTLEEPPSNTLIILATAQPDLLLETIRSRCQITYFAPTASKPIDSTQSKELFEMIPTTSLGALIAKAAEYKERPTAIILVQQTLKYLQTLPPGPTHANLLKATLECWQALVRNGNVLLALEHWLFIFHDLLANTNQTQGKRS